MLFSLQLLISLALKVDCVCAAIWMQLRQQHVVDPSKMHISSFWNLHATELALQRAERA